MITDFSIFNSKGEFKSGDYFIIREPAEFSIYTKMKDKVGFAIRVRPHYGEFDADIEGKKYHGLSIDAVEYWSENKKDMEKILDIKKFNL